MIGKNKCNRHSQNASKFRVEWNIYHKIINRSGKIENGRPEYWMGAHVKGKNNISLGVCLIGRSNFTKKQYSSLKVLKNGNLYILMPILLDIVILETQTKLVQILM